METRECNRELIVDAPADQVWEWLSNLHNAMGANQFHFLVDIDDATAASPTRGVEVPILHRLIGREFFKIARLTTYKDYEAYWGERMMDPDKPDAFPHSSGFRVESIGSNTSRIHAKLRGRYMTPAAELIGGYVFDLAMPYTLDADLQEVAYGCGAIKEKKRFDMPQGLVGLTRLLYVRTIDGETAHEFLSRSFDAGTAATAAAAMN